MKRTKTHPPYHFVFAALKVANISHETMSGKLNVSVRNFRDRVNGYGDFKFTEGNTIIKMILEKRPDFEPYIGCLFIA